MEDDGPLGPGLGESQGRYQEIPESCTPQRIDAGKGVSPVQAPVAAWVHILPFSGLWPQAKAFRTCQGEPASLFKILL